LIGQGKVSQHDCEACDKIVSLSKGGGKKSNSNKNLIAPEEGEVTSKGREKAAPPAKKSAESETRGGLVKIVVYPSGGGFVAKRRIIRPL